MKALVRRLVPYRMRVRVRALLEGRRLDPRDVARVREVTAAQWRTVGQHAPHYIDAYWDQVDDPDTDTVAKRRSEWLVGLEPFRVARSALELGCNVGRNLFVLQQRYPEMALHGVDINTDAIEYARTRVRAEFLVGDLYDLDMILSDRMVDIIFTMGVLIHLHPDALPQILEVMARHAQRALVLVEQVSADNTVVKGPASWLPERRVTGEYIQWSPDLPGILGRVGLKYTLSDVPTECQSNGARHLLIVDKERC